MTWPKSRNSHNVRISGRYKTDRFGQKENKVLCLKDWKAFIEFLLKKNEAIYRFNY